MGDALGRLILPVKGFILQFTAGIAPAITAVSNLIVGFFSENTKGWSLASSLANGFVFILRMVVGAFTFMYGVLQLASAGLAAMGQIGMNAFGFLLKGLSAVQEGIAVLMDVIGMLGKFLVDMIMAPIKGIMSTVASMAEAVGATDIAADLRLGMKVADGLTEGWDKFGNVVRGTTFLEDAANDAFSEAAVYGAAADGLAASGMANITNPFGAFDAALAKAKAGGGDDGEKPRGEKPVPQAVGAAIKASVQELKAIVVGSSEGEAFRNNIMRGADPRLDVKDDARKTADNTERAADALDDIAARLDPTGLAVIG
jgi:hypothetical protein